jgi:hypothetical protein
LTTLT